MLVSEKKFKIYRECKKHSQSEFLESYVKLPDIAGQ
jgi:hypothetical protein